MQYLRSYRAAFESPSCLVNILVGILCLGIIPVLGPILWLGYEFEQMEERHLTASRRRADFTFNRFSQYFMRGLWAFLMTLLIVLPLMFFIIVLYVAIAAVVTGLASRNLNEVTAILIVSGLVALILFLYFLVSVLAVPLMLHAGLKQEFAFGEAWAFRREFNRRVFKELVLSRLFMLVLGNLTMLAGALACCVGFYPAQVVVVMADFDLLYQLYQLYLERGGPAIPLKVEDVVPAR